MHKIRILLCASMIISGGFAYQQLPFTGFDNQAAFSWSAYRLYAPMISSGIVATMESKPAESIILPLKRAGNLILLEAVIDGITGNLILDSGSAALVLNSMYFREGRTDANLASGGVTGAIGSISTFRVNSLLMSDLEYRRLEANALDLGHIENARNIKVLGFFGLGLFRDFEIIIDLQTNVLELQALNLRGIRLSSRLNPQKYDLLLPASVHSDVVFIDVNINKARLRFCLDTGAESNVLASSLPDRILRTVDVFRRSTLWGAGGQSAEVLYGVMNDLKIGSKKFDGMQVMITNLNTMNKFYGVTIDGMLGCEFFERGKFFINLKREQVGIVFNKENQ